MRRILWVFILIGIFLVACTETSEFKSEGILDWQSHGEKYFLTINIIPPSSSMTRAEDESDSWIYEDGTPDENYIQSVRFFFFDDDKKAIAVRSDSESPGKSFSYYDWYPGEFSIEQESNGNMMAEKVYSTTLMIETGGGKLPTQVIAIVNPNENILQLQNPDISDLEDMTDDYSSNLARGKFVMSNSVYKEGRNEDSQLVNATIINRNNLCESEEEALLHSIYIYVERVVARVDLSFEMSSIDLTGENEGGFSKVFPTGQKFKIGEIEKEIYVKMLGWGVTTSPVKSRLLKHVDLGWNEDTFFDENQSWNDAMYHRSFWAINPENTTYKRFSYNQISGLGKNETREPGCYSVDVKNTAYIHENANIYKKDKVDPTNPEYPTQVICAGQLIDSDGKEISLAEYNSRQFTIEGLKEMVASNELDMYYLEDNTFIKIKKDHLTFETSMQHEGEEGPEQENTYLAYFKLTDDAAKLIWYHKFNVDEIDEADIENYRITDPIGYIDSILLPAKIWNKGYTYYFFEIPHYGIHQEAPGYFGVVRNHFYNAKILSLTSLGTPVYDPDEFIYPEKPGSSGNYLEVIIKIAQWRKAKKNFQLSW